MSWHHFISACKNVSMFHISMYVCQNAQKYVQVSILQLRIYVQYIYTELISVAHPGEADSA
jgi:hypothetical protein